MVNATIITFIFVFSCIVWVCPYEDYHLIKLTSLPTLLSLSPSPPPLPGFYELIKTLLTSSDQHLSNPSSLVIFVSASTGGVLYWVLTYPIDVLKSTLQSDESDVAKRKFKGIGELEFV